MKICQLAVVINSNILQYYFCLSLGAIEME